MDRTYQIKKKSTAVSDYPSSDIKNFVMLYENELADLSENELGVVLKKQVERDYLVRKILCDAICATYAGNLPDRDRFPFVPIRKELSVDYLYKLVDHISNDLFLIVLTDYMKGTPYLVSLGYRYGHLYYELGTYYTLLMAGCKISLLANSTIPDLANNIMIIANQLLGQSTVNCFTCSLASFLTDHQHVKNAAFLYSDPISKEWEDMKRIENIEFPGRLIVVEDFSEEIEVDSSSSLHSLWEKWSNELIDSDLVVIRQEVTGDGYRPKDQSLIGIGHAPWDYMYENEFFN